MKGDIGEKTIGQRAGRIAYLCPAGLMWQFWQRSRLLRKSA